MNYPKLFIVCWTAVWCFALVCMGLLFFPVQNKLSLFVVLVNFQFHVKKFVLYGMPLYAFCIWMIGVLVILGADAYLRKRKDWFPDKSKIKAE